MPTLRVYVTLMLCTVILFSCNNKKVKANTDSVEQVASADTSTVLIGNTDELITYNNDFIQNSVQKFTAPPQTISVITAKSGLKVTVDPAVLQKEDGTPVDGKITVSIIELVNSTDLFKSNVATISNGHLLVSGGSYFVGMECNGQKVTIKNDKKLLIDLPKLKANEMQLFYGNRDTSGNMNWVKADQSLVFNEATENIPYDPPFPYKESPDKKSKYYLYDSLNSKVVFGGKEMTMKTMVNLLQQKGIDKEIDTVYFYWNSYEAYRQNCFSNYDYERRRWKKYRIISCKDLEAEKDSIAKDDKIKVQKNIANEKYDEEWQSRKDKNSLTGQLQKYYATSSITKLGWINCDRFYNNIQNAEVPIDLPITFKKAAIKYFIIYRSFNGLMSGKLDEANKFTLYNLPINEPVTLITFAKYNGQVFQCKQDFVIQKDQSIKLDFKNISAEELTKMFGKNVRV